MNPAEEDLCRRVARQEQDPIGVHSMNTTADMFVPFPKIARLSREVIVTEKIDGSNACVFVSDDGLSLRAASRTRWITPGDDNFGFARWCEANTAELLKLGPGRHYGEWWGSGIQRGYGLPKGEKRFSLFNVARWADRHTVPPESENSRLVDLDTMKWAPACCYVVPVLARASGFEALDAPGVMQLLGFGGSCAAPGFMKPEGIVIFHAQGNVAFKKTFDKDDAGKDRGA